MNFYVLKKDGMYLSVDVFGWESLASTYKLAKHFSTYEEARAYGPDYKVYKVRVTVSEYEVVE